MNNIFHYAFKVKDLESTRHFYCHVLNCKEGRSTGTWVDFDFFGNQLSAHIGKVDDEKDYCGLVDGISVPIPHFGCVLSTEQFNNTQKLLEDNNVQFLLKPQKRYKGQNSEQKTMFVFDLSGNPLEFKSFTDDSQVFMN